ncbi:hypothetical protein [Mucilaginibacter sp. BT774]|uniref:hypothetical protein n=1 Tax=Mucilaginibacter sp. BT774 TaxID=3062276 RepID=UPI0026753A41|nr:hypothetical protein [Mucilaginibacter sp. BT774]MDO3628310.1 hypothetical protein [Mucilaginibacter sp. BT774]
MKLIDSTAEILAFKVLNRNIDKRWVNWATDMLMSGFDTENLIILAGEQVPYNQFELIGLTNKIFDELNIDLSDDDTIIKKYACYLINKALTGEMQADDVLNILKVLCIELDYDRNLYDFYLLYFAKEDLKYSDNQWYWNGADKANINTIIYDYFVGWKQNCSN